MQRFPDLRRERRELVVDDDDAVSPDDTPMLPPEPVSMYTVPATFCTLISTLLKSCWAKAEVAAKTKTAIISLRMAADCK